MYRKLTIAALALTLSPLAVAAQSGKTEAPTVQTFSNTVSAKGLKNIKLTVKVGKIKITANQDDNVIIKTAATAGEDMHFIFDWTTGKSANALPSGLHLVTHRDGDTLVVSLEIGSHSSDDNTEVINPLNGSVTVNGHSNPGWKSNWTVSLPAQLALNLIVGVGKASVQGLAGGLKAKIGVGKLNVGLKQGPIDANVGVGDINAEVMSADYGAVDLSAGVGHAEFFVNGQQNTQGFEQHFTASSQKLTGEGKTAYSLKAGVGHIKLSLGVKKFSTPDADSDQ